jgi:hypothetical protein
MKNIIIRAFATVAIAVAAIPAAAQTLLLDLSPTTIPLAATLDNPCTPQLEAIAFQGTTSFSQRVWLMPDGDIRLQFAENTALQGQNALALLGTPNKYVASGAAQQDFEFAPMGLSVLQYKKVTSDGLADNFHAVLVLDFDPQNLRLELKLEAQCDDGRP